MTEITNLLDMRQTGLHTHVDIDGQEGERETSQGSRVAM
jgi:hypothetical protein